MLSSASLALLQRWHVLQCEHMDMSFQPQVFQAVFGQYVGSGELAGSRPCVALGFFAAPFCAHQVRVTFNRCDLRSRRFLVTVA